MVEVIKRLLLAPYRKILDGCYSDIVRLIDKRYVGNRRCHALRPSKHSNQPAREHSHCSSRKTVGLGSIGLTDGDECEGTMKVRSVVQPGNAFHPV